jgi:Peptidase S24-like
MDDADPRQVLARLIADNEDDCAGLSRLVGRNLAYIQQYIKRGSPKKLGERERSILARYFGVDERILGAPEIPRGAGLRLVPKLAVGASAGTGALTERESLAGMVGFDERWLRRMGVDPAALTLIRVQGDSMVPTLMDGDDIMVEKGAAARPLKDGVYVLRMDDSLMVKRLRRLSSGNIAIVSDNPAHRGWPDVDPALVQIIGRVVWAARAI